MTPTDNETRQALEHLAAAIVGILEREGIGVERWRVQTDPPEVTLTFRTDQEETTVTLTVTLDQEETP